MMVEDWTNVTLQALQGSWETMLLFLPKLIGAFIVFVIGYIVAIWIGKLIAGILNKIKFDSIFDKSGWKEAFEKAEIKVEASEFVGAIFKWIIVIIFLTIAADILEWSTFAMLLVRILAWIPNLLVSVALLVVAIVIADILEKIVKTSTEKMGVSFVNMLGTAVKWAIYVFAILAVLLQLGIAPAIVNTIIVGIVATLSLAFGLAFGLGGKEAAARTIEDVRKKISEK